MFTFYYSIYKINMDTFTALSDFASFDTLYDVSLAEGMAASEATMTLAEPYVFVDYLTRDAFWGWQHLDAEGNFILAEMEETEAVAASVATGAEIGLLGVVGGALAGVGLIAGGIYLLVSELNRRADEEERLQAEADRYNGYYAGERADYIKRAREYFLTHPNGPEDAMTQRIFQDGMRFVQFDQRQTQISNWLYENRVTIGRQQQVQASGGRGGIIVGQTPVDIGPYTGPQVLTDDPNIDMPWAPEANSGIIIPPENPWPGRRPIPTDEYNKMIEDSQNTSSTTIEQHPHVDLPSYFDADLARFLLKFASAAYGNEKGYHDEIQQEYDYFQEFNHMSIGSSCIVAANRFHIVISFRGTATLTDCLADATIVPVAGVHGGFLYWAESLRPELFDALYKLQAQNKRRVLLTGHSLGGCLSQIFARFYTEKVGKPPDAVYTFDSPACFSPNVAQGYDRVIKNSWRVYTAEDPVVFILNAFYSHTKQCAEIEANGNVLFTPTSGIRLNVFKHSLDTIAEYLKHTRSTARLSLTKNRLGFVQWNQFLDAVQLSESYYLDPNTPQLNLSRTLNETNFIDSSNVFIQSIITTF